jgi:hypothetical protein
MISDELMRMEPDTETDRDLDQLIRWTLQADIGDETPSDRVWQRIQTSLDGGPLAFPEVRERKIFWPGLAQMASLAVALCLILGVVLTLEVYTSQSALHGQGYWVSGYASPVVISHEDVPSGRLAYMTEREQRYMQRSLSPERDPLLVNRRKQS